MKLFFKYFSVAILLYNSVTISAQANYIEVSSKKEVFELGRYATVFIDSSASLAFEDILSDNYQNKFTPSTTDVINYGVTSNAVWVKIVLKKQLENINVDWLLALDYPLFDYVTFYQKNAKDSWAKVETGDLFPYRTRLIPNRNFLFSPYLTADKEATFYLRFRTNGSMQINPKLYRESAFLLESTQSEVAYGLFYGGMFIIIFYNLFLFFSLKDWTYLAYCVFIFSTTFQQACYSGHVNEFLLGNNVYWSNLSIPLVMATVPAFISLFAILFLKTWKFTPFWHKFLVGTIIFLVFLSIASFFIPTIISIPISGIITIITHFSVIFAGVISYKNGNKAARFYLLAWTILLATGLINAFRLFGILPTTDFTVHSVRFGIWLEAVLLSLALADKYNLFRQEKAEAQKKVLLLQAEANKNLEDKVRLRTHELSITNSKLAETLTKVEEERKKSDQLLLNILPAETASELKTKGTSMPKQYDLVTVLFTDFKNFSHLVEVLPPVKIIEVLGICFLAFDEICERNNIEKIKTIGDSYMAAGGLPLANLTNPIDAVKTALEIQTWMSNWDQTKFAVDSQIWELRIGIHTGPVMAGVVGKNKFAYDIWGNTVNIASRMETTSEVGKVSISKKTYELVKDYFYCEYRGKVAAKNIGEVDAYWVTGVKEEVSL